jgi:hypothetical protein
MSLRNLRMLVSLSCEEASRLASESLDRELSRTERWALRFHAFLCRNCRQLILQLARIRKLLSNMPAASHEHVRKQLPKLSPGRKQQIKQLLRDASKAEPG